MPANPSYLENAFALWLAQLGQPLTWYEREYQFHRTRRWRLDFAWISPKIAVEIEGVRYDGKGRHQTLKGFTDDAEKYEAALLLGWRVYRVPGPWIAEAKGDDVRLIWRVEVMDTLRTLLEVA